MRVQERNKDIKKLKTIQEKIKNGNYTGEDILSLTEIMMSLLITAKRLTDQKRMLSTSYNSNLKMSWGNCRNRKI